MTTNNTNDINTGQHINKARYSESKGTGVLSALIFAILVIVFMIVLVHFKGS